MGKGRSLGAFNTFYKVDDHYETNFDAKGVFPYVFMRRVSEGGYEFSQDYVYNQHQREVTTQEQGDACKVPAGVQDMLSAFYYARTLDFSNAKPGDMFIIETFLDDELWPLRMRYIGKETIKLRNGKYRCMKFQPVVQEGRIFKGNDDLNVWITDDGNRIPVLAQAKVLVGSIKMELSAYEGLAHPIADSSDLYPRSTRVETERCTPDAAFGVLSLSCPSMKRWMKWGAVAGAGRGRRYVLIGVDVRPQVEYVPEDHWQ